ncbi:MAG: DUF1877 family protein [Rhodocyclaceae bacterium]
MTYQGIHFALDADQEARLLGAEGDDDALLDVIADIEEAWDKNWLAESDTAWDAIHRCFCNGELLYEGGEYPLNHLICGGRQLVAWEETEYTVSYVSAAQVKEIAIAARRISRDSLHERYDEIDRESYGSELSDEDFAYVWTLFSNVVNLFERAAAANRAVIFTVDA